ncbi:MAG: DegT/DnrJ/EryC1/StrS family aminotransferase [Deltaproteobacteria bacterium]|nr:DegT/DnrJ/EryC1/StrS family aminotransferase [Deltaproteobacteria bacterium]
MIPFVDLKAQYLSLKEEIDTAVAKIFESCQFILGDEVSAFEKEFAAYTGTRFGIAVNSGTSALHLALLAAGIGLGDEVITVPFTFVATVAAIEYVGARPVFVDIEPGSYTMNAKQIEEKITEHTKAILPVHLYGQPADMDPIQEIARRNGLVIVEDAAQAHGAEYKGQRVGGIGHLGCFSFYPGKNLGAYGEGGMVVTNNPEYDRLIRMLRDWGQDRKYSHVLKGFNFRMEGLQGAILRVKLRHLEAWTESRRTHADEYRNRLIGCDLQLPEEMPYAHHVYHVFTVRFSRRNVLQEKLTAEGIQTGIHYPLPVHLQMAYSNLGYQRGDFPFSESAAEEVLSLPLYPEMNETQIERVCKVIKQNG